LALRHRAARIAVRVDRVARTSAVLSLRPGVATTAPLLKSTRWSARRVGRAHRVRLAAQRINAISVSFSDGRIALNSALVEQRAADLSVRAAQQRHQDTLVAARSARALVEAECADARRRQDEARQVNARPLNLSSFGGLQWLNAMCDNFRARDRWWSLQSPAAVESQVRLV